MSEPLSVFVLFVLVIVSVNAITNAVTNAVTYTDLEKYGDGKFSYLKNLQLQRAMQLGWTAMGALEVLGKLKEPGDGGFMFCRDPAVNDMVELIKAKIAEYDPDFGRNQSGGSMAVFLRHYQFFSEHGEASYKRELGY